MTYIGAGHFSLANVSRCERIKRRTSNAAQIMDNLSERLIRVRDMMAEWWDEISPDTYHLESSSDVGVVVPQTHLGFMLWLFSTMMQLNYVRLITVEDFTFLFHGSNDL